MADTKITGLTADASPSSDDLVVTVNDPAGIPANRKVALGDLAAFVKTNQSLNAWSDPVDANIVPDADGTRNLGSATNRFANLHVDSIDLNGTTLTGSALADPGQDALLAWDDSATDTAFFTLGAGLSTSGTVISANIDSDPTGVTGADQVTNVMSLTTAEYGAITPNASTLYLITDA